VERRSIRACTTDGSSRRAARRTATTSRSPKCPAGRGDQPAAAADPRPRARFVDGDQGPHPGPSALTVGLLAGGGARYRGRAVTGISALNHSRTSTRLHAGLPVQHVVGADAFRMNRRWSYLGLWRGPRSGGAGAYFLVHDSSSGTRLATGAARRRGRVGASDAGRAVARRAGSSCSPSVAARSPITTTFDAGTSCRPLVRRRR